MQTYTGFLIRAHVAKRNALKTVRIFLIFFQTVNTEYNYFNVISIIATPLFLIAQ